MPQMPPENREEWERAARSLGIFDKTVHERTDWKSGSKLEEKDFIYLRTTRSSLLPRDAIEGLQLRTYVCRAKALLDQQSSFIGYLTSLSVNFFGGDIGQFRVTKGQQEQIIALEWKQVNLSGLPDVNEDIVNTSSVNLGAAVCEGHLGIPVSWTPHRAAYKHIFYKALPARPRAQPRPPKSQAKQQTGGDRDDMESKVKAELSCELDGYLYSKTTMQTLMILEAKRGQRKSHEPQVSWQETIELIAGILNPAPKGLLWNSAFLISQDGTEMYISQASYEGDWKDYMLGHKDKPEDGDFARVEIYGPWSITKRQEVKEFAHILLALTLRAVAEEQQAASTGTGA